MCYGGKIAYDRALIGKEGDFGAAGVVACHSLMNIRFFHRPQAKRYMRAT